jgi:2-desacetyl-2-hydroxyethyl bacteriochlorophyllide A dehydrogenase
MKALVYTAPHEIVYRDEPPPQLAADEVLIGVDAVGICGSDLHAYHGRDPRRVPPLILGHELAGRILEGPGAGRRVTVNPLITCRACDYCRQGRDNLCSRRTMIGMTRAGGFAELMTTAAASVIELPDSLGAREAALTEPASTALHAITLAMRALARPLQECDVLVQGGGAIGMLATLLLTNYGVRNVTTVETNPLRRASLARATRATVRDPSTSAPADGSADLVIDAVGAAVTRNAALACIRPGGVIVHVGLQDWASEIDMRRLTLGEITLIGTYTYSTADLRASVRALHEGAFGDLAWVEERPLAEGAAAFRDLHEGRAAAAKIVLRP